MSFTNDTKHLIVLEPPPVEFEEDYLEPPPSYDYLPEEEGQRSPTHSAHFIESGLGYPYPSSLGTSSSTYLSSPTASPRASYVSLSSASHRMSGTPSIDHRDDDNGATGYAPSLTPPSKDAPHPDKVGKLVSGRCPQRLLNPPPPCFSRPRSESMQYPPFPTITVASIGKHYLAKGFPATLPPSETRPHPFATHDVTEEEWMHFLADLKRAAGLGWGDRLVGNVAPLLVGVPYVPGVAGHQKGKKVVPALELLYHWNCQYFHPRCLEVHLTQRGVVAQEWGHSQRMCSGEDDQPGWYMHIAYRPLASEARM